MAMDGQADKQRDGKVGSHDHPIKIGEIRLAECILHGFLMAREH